MTQDDLSRLAELVALYGDAESDAAEALQQALDGAVVVAREAVAPSVVTMSSRVICRDDRGQTRELQLVYPKEADTAAGRISVLAPFGRALLGAAVGDRIEVVSGTRSRTWTVEAIRYQPEAAGDPDP